MDWIFEMLEEKGRRSREARQQAAADNLAAHHPGLDQNEARRMARGIK